MAVSGWSDCPRCGLEVPDYLLPTGHVCVPPPRCSCESSECHHAYGAVPAGTTRVQWIGTVCDDCARTHLAPYVLT